MNFVLLHLGLYSKDMAVLVIGSLKNLSSSPFLAINFALLA